VKSPGGGEHEVLVQIDEETIGYVERMTRRQLPAENSFWTIQAQRLLSDYLWKEGKVPPTRKLTIKDADRDELPMAGRAASSPKTLKLFAEAAIARVRRHYKRLSKPI
jgi:hypothetical protein